MKLAKNKNDDLDLKEQQKLEGLLTSTIKPVAPSLSFVETLEQRLRIDPETLQAHSGRSRANYLLMIGVITLAIAITTVASIRIAVGFLGLIGLAQQLNKNIQNPDDSNRSVVS